MKKSILTLLLLSIGLFAFTSLQAQDIIIMKDGEKVKVKIKEITDNVVKYHHYEDPDGILFTMNRGLISEIQYEFGLKEKEVGPVVNKLYYIDDRLSNLKVSFTAFASQALALTYERSLQPGASIEATLKIHGIGVDGDDNESRSGFGLNLGYKMKFSNVFSAGDGYRPGHIMSGGYFRPNAGFDLINRENTFFNDEERKLNVYHFGMDFGYQWVINNRLSMDIFGGPHYYGQSKERNGRGDFFEESGFTTGDFLGIADGIGASYGFRIGYVFGKKKNESIKKRR